LYPPRSQILFEVFTVRSVRGHDVTYTGGGIGGGHDVHGIRPSVQDETARIRTIRRVDLDDFTVHDSGHNLGTAHAAFQKSFKRVLVSVNASLRRSATQNFDVAIRHHTKIHS
jgi:hypothetical protein